MVHTFSFFLFLFTFDRPLCVCWPQLMVCFGHIPKFVTVDELLCAIRFESCAAIKSRKTFVPSSSATKSANVASFGPERMGFVSCITVAGRGWRDPEPTDGGEGERCALIRQSDPLLPTTARIGFRWHTVTLCIRVLVCVPCYLADPDSYRLDETDDLGCATTHSGTSHSSR